MLIDSVVQVFDLFTNFLFILSIIERGVLKSLTKILDLSVSPFSSISFSFMYFEALLLGA